MNVRSFFDAALSATSEKQVDELISSHANGCSWVPLGANENNFGLIETQQASPVAALVEKITNSIDALLMRRCLEEGVDPTSLEAPRDMGSAIETWFGPDQKSWHLPGIRRRQAEQIQILAVGSRTRPCLTVYDDGEGQHPDDFEDTFLSLLRGNKNDVAFVQGKYNMGGTGAIVFCGERRYHLIASRR